MPMTTRITVAGLQVAAPLYDLVRDEIAPGTGIEPDAFWSKLADIVTNLGDRNRDILAVRDALQSKVDTWHTAHRDLPVDLGEYTAFLREIGYLRDEEPEVQASTSNVDPEIASIAGPQLVVPVDNPRYALNAANARWGSLYDALYGTNVLPEDGDARRGTEYNPVRGRLVMNRAAEFLDQVAPLESGSHKDITGFSLEGEESARTLRMTLVLRNRHRARGCGSVRRLPGARQHPQQPGSAQQRAASGDLHRRRRPGGPRSPGGYQGCADGVSGDHHPGL